MQRYFVVNYMRNNDQKRTSSDVKVIPVAAVGAMVPCGDDAVGRFV
jgi:hypothetical protein